jgi:hypothetical protein
VYIDGKIAGRVKYLETIKIMVAPGQHEVYIKMDFNESHRVTVNCSLAKETNLATGVKIEPFMFSMVRAFARPKEYFVLEETGLDK